MIPRETYLIKKGLIKLGMGTKVAMVVYANHGEEVVGHMTSNYLILGD